MNQPGLTLEIFGYIKKEELLVTVESNIIHQSLVLESQKPFPGYLGNIPNKSQPQSLFLITIKEYSFEEISRITNKIKETFKHDFNASQGYIHFKSESFPCIRIKYLKSFTFIPELQNCYKDADIKFAKHRSINATAIIVINKNFLLSDKGNGIYKDMEEESKCYFELPEYLGWDQFKSYTNSVKYNIDNNNFDAAQGVLFRKSGIIDIVRIYDQEKTYERIDLLHKAYINEIHRNRQI